MHLNENFQRILQELMASSVMKEDELSIACQKNTIQENLEEIIKNLSKAIRPFSLDIKRIVYDDGMVYYAVVNTVSDELSRLGNNFQPWEIVLFRKTIEIIMESSSGEVRLNEILNLRDKNSIYEVQQVIDTLTLEKWLQIGDQMNHYSLGPRCFAELMSFLRDLGLVQCPICSCDVLRGINCQTTNCGTRVHFHCAKSYYERMKGKNFKCSNCNIRIEQ